VSDHDALDLDDKTTAQSQICGFWVRALAALVDCVPLALVGGALGALYFDSLAQLGAWGRLLGFCIALVYFGVLNSAIGNGQTIGKYIMRIRVVDRSGRPISLGRSLLRYVVLGSPVFMNGLLLPVSSIPSVIVFLIGFVVFGIGGAGCYLYVFNRRTRQSFHDLVVGTFVTKATPRGQVDGTIWSPHLFVVAGWLAAVTGVFVAMSGLSRQGIVPSLMKVQRDIQATGNAHTAEVSVGTFRPATGDRKQLSCVKTRAFWKAPPDLLGVAARQVALIVLRDYPEAMKMDVIDVTICYGYDIGISSFWMSQTYCRSPSEWQAMLANTAAK
jgi:uncharacterized RDD family membrane protein YckC